MTPETISLRLDDEMYRELEELAAVWRITPAELDEWRNDPAYQAEIAEVRAEVEEPRAW